MVYEGDRKKFNRISEVTEKEYWKVGIGVETDMFIIFVENATESVFINVLKVKAKFAELNAKRIDRAQLKSLY